MALLFSFFAAISWLTHCKIGFDREMYGFIDVLVILVEGQQTAELQICTVCLRSWHHHLPLLERLQVASREGHQGNFQIGRRIIHIKTTCSNFSLKSLIFYEFWTFLEMGIVTLFCR